MTRRSTKLRFCWAPLLITASSCQAQSGTRELGPTKDVGWPNRIVLDPSSSGGVYVSGNHDLFHSPDRGETWRKLTPDPSPWFWLGDLAIDSRARTLYLGVSLHDPSGNKTTGAVYSSRDDGRSWIALGPGFDKEVLRILVDPSSDPPGLYAGTGGAGLFKSVDGGVSWKPCNEGLKGKAVSALVLDPRNSAIYVGTEKGLFRSEDGAKTWQRVPMRVPLDDSDTGEVKDQELSVTSVLPHPRGPKFLYASTTFGLYRSADGGEEWGYANAGIGEERRDNHNVSVVVLDPLAPASGPLYAGSTTGLFRSVDLGKSWSPVGDDLASTGVCSIAIDPGPPWTLYAGTEKGVYRVTGAGPAPERKKPAQKPAEPAPVPPAMQLPGRVGDLLRELAGAETEAWTKRVRSEDPAVQDEVTRHLAEIILQELQADLDEARYPKEAEALGRLLEAGAVGPGSEKTLLEISVLQALHMGHGAADVLTRAGPYAIPLAVRLREDRHPHVQTVLGHALVVSAEIARELIAQETNERQREILRDYGRVLRDGSPVESPYYLGVLALLGEPVDLDTIFKALDSTTPADHAFVHQWAAKLLPDLREAVYGPEGAALKTAIEAHTGNAAGLGAWKDLDAKLRQWLGPNRSRIRHDPAGRRYVLAPP